LAQLEASVERISAWTINRGEGEIPARLLGKKVMAELKTLDDVAYIRFASVYRTFKDVQEFVETLEDAELLDFADTSNPQLSLTSMNFVESEKNPSHETDSKTTSPRTRTSNPLSN
jgi:transcriptional repressor NrdR